jgi:hypothetical protein
MADFTRGYSFGSTEQVTNAKLHALVDDAEVSNIDNDDISASAAIAYSKLSIGAAAINYDRLNLTGSIVNADVSGSAAIAYSKLNLTGGIVNADVNASAAIVDTKLAQIATAGKVSGAALTSLSSIPAGAGVIPAANLPGGTFKFTSKTTVSAAATTGNISITNTNYYKVNFHLTGFSGDDIIGIRFNADTGASNYQWFYDGRNTAGIVSGADDTASSIQIGPSYEDSGSTALDGTFEIFPQNGTAEIHVIGRAVYNGGGGVTSLSFAGRWVGGSAATSFSMITNGGSVTFSGDVTTYQIQQS